jgi:molecular chaperone HscB
MQNHFELFHLAAAFAVDVGAGQAYREVQNQVHPDKFANATDAEKRVAMQWATRANEAYQTLKNPQSARLSVRAQRRRFADRIEHVDADGLPDAANGMARSAGRRPRRKDSDALEALDKQLRATQGARRRSNSSSGAGDFVQAAAKVRR